MPSRLSSLLVRDGLVGVKRMEKAFQRQVIYGGSLDTILLEMSLVPEERLTQYLALASGLPPAARDDGEALDPEAVAMVSRELAEQYRAVPIAFERDAIRVLVCAPLELTELEDLADLLDRPLQPLIAPEFRWHLVFAAAYGLDPPARFTTLARAVAVDPTPAPVGRAPTIIVDEPGAAIVVSTPAPRIAPVPANAETLKVVSVNAPPTAGDEPARQRRHTIMGVIPNRAATDGTVQPRGSEDDTPPSGSLRVRKPGSGPSRPPPGGPPTDRTFISPASVVAAAASAPSAPAAPPTERSLTPSGAHASVSVTAERVSAVYANGPATERVSGPHPSTSSPSASGSTARPHGGLRAPARSSAARATPIPTEGRDSPLPIVRAREILATADDRDTVFLTLLRAARSRARWAGLLTVQGGAAIGRVALAEPGIDTSAVHTVLIPLDAVSAFRTVVGNHQSHIGPLVSGDPGIDSMVLRLGGTMPPSALLLPIVLRDRVVAIVVAHRLNSDLKLVDVTELLPMATAASDAIGRLIVKSKSAGHRAMTEPSIVEIEAENVETKRISRAEAEWRDPEVTPSLPRFEQGVELSMEAGEPRPIDEVLSDVERAAEGGAEDAIAEAVERASETARALLRRFPGKLRVDRFAVTGRTLRPSQYGGLLELVIRLGAASADLLIDRMSAPQRDIRFYATLCAAELRPRTAVFALAERLFDQDFGVRASAIEALAGYPGPELGHALVRARRAVHSTDADVVAAASGAIVTLGDTEAISDLIGVIERSDRGGDHARRALTSLTAQDFGASERKWRKWYETARRRHRVEWLIEGLGHKEDAIRENAINVLRRLTGEYFGYHHDLPRKERDAAAERWAAWWRDAGHRRFALPTDDGLADVERHRPTAELPGRRD
jgi:HEAT repeat protein